MSLISLFFRGTTRVIALIWRSVLERSLWLVKSPRAGGGTMIDSTDQHLLCLQVHEHNMFFVPSYEVVSLNVFPFSYLTNGLHMQNFSTYLIPLPSKFKLHSRIFLKNL